MMEEGKRDGKQGKASERNLLHRAVFLKLWLELFAIRDGCGEFYCYTVLKKGQDVDGEYEFRALAIVVGARLDSGTWKSSWKWW